MKINSTVFTVLAILLVGIVSYYIGVSNQRGNPHRPTQTTIEKEHSTTPKTVSKQTEAKETKINNQKVLTGQPNYTSKLDIQKGKQGEPLLTGRGIDTPSATPVLQKTVALPPPPDNPDDMIVYKTKIYKANALTKYHVDMLNAGDDEFLKQTATQNYMLNSAKIVSWQRNIENKFRLIKNDENLDRDEMNFLKANILNRAGDPIYVSDQERLRSEKIFNKQSLDELAQQQQWQQSQLDDVEQQQRWNNMERDNWQLKYNAFDNKWQYAPSNSQLKYNPFDNSWQYVPSP